MLHKSSSSHGFSGAFKRSSRGRHSGGGGHGEGSWAVSYVDMLTLLLCFFIIFFSSDRVKVSGSTLKKIEAKFQSRDPSSVAQGEGSGGQGQGGAEVNLGKKGAGYGNATGAWSYFGGKVPATGGLGSGTSLEIRPIEAISKQIDERTNWATSYKRVGNMVELEFEGVSFFESGSNRLTLEGKKMVQEMIDLLSPYKSTIKVTIQGHTDARKIIHSRSIASDNWELSVIRATAVLKVFREQGFPQELLSAEGFSYTRTPASIDLSKQRRVTLKIEEIAQ